MSELEKLRRFFDANTGCGDSGEAEAARMRAEIAAATQSIFQAHLAQARQAPDRT